MSDIQEKKYNAGRLRSMAKIVDALLQLMREKPYVSVTVTEICSRAHVARKTFYRSFDSKDAVISYRLGEMFKALSEKFDFVETEARELLMYSFDYLEKNKLFAAAFTDDGVIPLLEKEIIGFVQIAYDYTLHNSASFEPTYGEYYYKFTAVGFISIVQTWVASDFKLPTAMLVALTRRLLSGVLA